MEWKYFWMLFLIIRPKGMKMVLIYHLRELIITFIICWLRMDVITTLAGVEIP